MFQNNQILALKILHDIIGSSKSSTFNHQGSCGDDRFHEHLIAEKTFGFQIFENQKIRMSRVQDGLIEIKIVPQGSFVKILVTVIVGIVILPIVYKGRIRIIFSFISLLFLIAFLLFINSTR